MFSLLLPTFLFIFSLLHAFFYVFNVDVDLSFLINTLDRVANRRVLGPFLNNCSGSGPFFTRNLFYWFHSPDRFLEPGPP